MPRSNRIQPAGVYFHVLNRGNEKRELFASPGDYEAFVRVLAQTQEVVPISLLAWCLMPNHWHLVLRPEHDGDLGRFMQRLTVKHVRRWHAHRKSTGLGHLYQGTYKSFPVQDDGHFLVLCRYVEGNPLRAGMVERAEAWPWSSLAQRSQSRQGEDWPRLADWPIRRPSQWTSYVNRSQPEKDTEAVQLSLRRGRPLGTADWTHAMAERLELTSTLRPRGRPRRAEGE